MERIDGNAVSKQIIEELTGEVAKIEGAKPCIVVVRVGTDPASVFYTRKKVRTAHAIGMESRLLELPEGTSIEVLFAEIDRLNQDPGVHGILVQSPIPGVPNERDVFNRVAVEKDVDGLNSRNLGMLCQDDPAAFPSCTPAGIVELLRRYAIETAGKRVVVVGRSLLVGKPVGLLLLRKGSGGDATVTYCHSRTPDLAAITRDADILIAAIGRPAAITADMVKPGATVIDVGINKIPDTAAKKGYRIVGDVDFEAVAPIASAITPVPGGVGPMTVAMLMRNTLQAWRQAVSRPA